jgi:Uncharacterized conserved protein (DUF2075)
MHQVTTPSCRSSRRQQWLQCREGGLFVAAHELELSGHKLAPPPAADTGRSGHDDWDTPAKLAWHLSGRYLPNFPVSTANLGMSHSRFCSATSIATIWGKYMAELTSVASALITAGSSLLVAILSAYIAHRAQVRTLENQAELQRYQKDLKRLQADLDDRRAERDARRDYEYEVLSPTDLRYDPDGGNWIGDKKRSHDRTVKQAKTEEEFLALVKNTYRVLLTRGMKGCAVYFMDAETRKFFRSRMK